MAKVLLVEDDNNLREIFEMRLQAEGYETLSASDGEEALVVATREKPDLIIADVMMPKLSGFEMLENLRAAPQMGNVKVVMMTALGQAEDRARGEKLGVVKYLVKSQVTLEDFVRVVREVLPPDGAAKASSDVADDEKNQYNTVTNKEGSEHTMQDNTNPSVPPADDSAPAANPISGGDAAGMPAGDQMSTAEEQSVVNEQINDFASQAPAGMPSDDSAAAAPASDPAPLGGMDASTAPSADTTMPPQQDTPAPEPPMPAPPADGSPQPPTEEPPQDTGPAGPPTTPGL